MGQFTTKLKITLRIKILTKPILRELEIYILTPSISVETDPILGHTNKISEK